MSPSTRIKLVISFALFVGTAAAFFSVAYFVKEKGHDLIEQIRLISKQQDQESTYLILRKQLEESEGKRAEVRRHFLEGEGQAINFVNEVEATAQKFGVSFKTNNLSFQGADEQWLEMSFTINGERELLHEFLRVLENLPYLTRIQDLKLESRSSTQCEADITMKVRVLDYDQ